MEASTLPKNITSTIDKMTKKPWTSIAQADAAADYIRELRTEAKALGELTPEEVEAKKRIDAKLADKTNAMKLANEVEQKFNPFFIKLAQDETTRINATLPVSKHRKFLEGKGWKTQLKDKPGQVSVTSEEDAIEWLEANEPTAVRIVKTVDLSRVASESVVSKLEQLGKKLTKFGFSLIEKLPDGNSTVKIKDFDSQS